MRNGIAVNGNVEVLIRVHSLMELDDVVRKISKLAKENPYVKFHIEADW